ncbi:MAG: hypothetical protein LBV34_19365, partial [Nocardiopsaceae bacterium]|nr:hypothetical protein [Nocardiopsaceae bacterium]
ALEPTTNGATEVSYSAHAQVDGAIAGIGQRMLASIVKRMASDAIAALDSALAAPGPADTTAASQVRAAQEQPADMSAASPARAAQEHPAGISVSAATIGLVAGASAAVAAIVVSVLARKRRGRR